MQINILQPMDFKNHRMLLNKPHIFWLQKSWPRVVKCKLLRRKISAV